MAPEEDIARLSKSNTRVGPRQSQNNRKVCVRRSHLPTRAKKGRDGLFILVEKFDVPCKNLSSQTSKLQTFYLNCKVNRTSFQENESID